MYNELFWTLITPFLGVVLLMIPGLWCNDSSGKKASNFGLLVSLITLFLSIKMSFNFNQTTQGYQFVELFIPGFIGVDEVRVLGIDGVALLLILLTTFLTPICFLISSNITHNKRLYVMLFLLLEFIVIGVFSSINVIVFYVMFEMSLIPMYFIIGIWGGDNRIYASFKFFLYTLAGSLIMLVAIMYLYNLSGSFDIDKMIESANMMSGVEQKYLWIAMFIAFAVKVPMFPFHTWLPDAHVQAPTAGSVMLAGILLKLGTYAMFRFMVPMFPIANAYFVDLVAVLSIISLIYASFVALAQKDMKKMIAYSSVAHMGYVTIGLFSMNHIGMNGAIIQMISHGIVSAALFIIVGVLYERGHTKEIEAYGGVTAKMPVLAMFFMIFTMSSVGLPGTSGFVGEVMATIGSFYISKLYGIFVTLGVIFGAVYMLYLYAKVMFGEIRNSHVESFYDLNKKELFALVPLAIMTIILGIYPKLMSDFINVSYLVASVEKINNNLSGVLN